MTSEALAVSVLVVVSLGALRFAASARRHHRARHRLDAVPSRAAVPRPLVAPPWLQRRLDAADLGPRAGALVAWWVRGVATIPLVALLLGGPALAVIAGGALVTGPLLALRLVGGRRDAHIEAALPLALEAMARTLRTAGSLRQAIGEAAEATSGALGDDLAAVVALVDRGLPLAAALDAWVDRRPLTAVRLAAAALALGAETGGAQARAVDGVAATIRERLAAAADMRAQATQARASAAVIAAAPVAFCALATATDARTATFLFRTPAGVVLLATGLGLDALGALWMGRLTRPSV